MQPNDTAPRKRAPRPLIDVTCEQCGAPFLARPSVLEKGSGRFCSRECYDRAPKNGQLRACEQCGIAFLATAGAHRRRVGHFCTATCYSKFQQLAASKRPARLLVTCEHCGTVFSRQPAAAEPNERQFCNRDCYEADRHQVAITTREARLWAYTDRTGDCWLWKRSLTGSGYGQFVVGHGRSMGAHRAAWELATGDTLAADDIIGHICDVKLCVRNDEAGWYKIRDMVLPRRGHLFKGTYTDNNRDLFDKGRGLHGSTHKMAKLTEDDVRLIRTLYGQGMDQYQLAEAFGVTQTAISAVVLRQTWKHVL